MLKEEEFSCNSWFEDEKGIDLQLRVKEARIRLYNADRFVESLYRIHCPHVGRDHGKEAELQILRV